MSAHSFCEIRRWGSLRSGLHACHGPHRLRPAQLLVKGWKCVPIAEEAPIGGLRYANNTLPLSVVTVCLVGQCDVPGSFRSRLLEGMFQ